MSQFSPMSRRRFLGNVGAVSASLTVAGLFARSGVAGAFPAGGYGPLITDPNGIVNLPAGFTYKVLAATSAVGSVAATQLGVRSPAENAGAVPGAPDGMASFYEPGTGRTYLVCNHELQSGAGVPKTFRGLPVPTYDSGSGAAGGCSVLVLDSNMDVIEHLPKLAGTIRNCAGGPTPWGTWLTCEENTNSISAGSGRNQNHGYIFEVDPIGNATSAVPYNAMGRCSHEAAAVDPTTGNVYSTEDAGGGLVYKFVPTNTSGAYGTLGAGGTTYAMKVPGISDFAALTSIGQTVTGVTWTQAANPDVASLNASFNSTTVTRGGKIEGCWWIDGSVWIVLSFGGSGGTAHSGLVLRYDPAAESITVITRVASGGQTVTLTDGITSQNHLLRDPDNICATPYGGAIWAQDGGSTQYLVGLSPNGSIFPLAANPGGGEWAGPNFSFDGQWLFANQQTRGLTLAITGPWNQGVEVPESPSNLVLPLAAAATVAGLVAVRQRGAVQSA